MLFTGFRAAQEDLARRPYPRGVHVTPEESVVIYLQRFAASRRRLGRMARCDLRIKGHIGGPNLSEEVDHAWAVFFFRRPKSLIRQDGSMCPQTRADIAAPLFSRTDCLALPLERGIFFSNPFLSAEDYGT